MLSQEEIYKLIDCAKEYRQNAFIPDSDHKVGACILTKYDNYYGGCNIRSNISGMGTCAERCAIDHAVSHGEYVFRALAVVDSYLNYPCGACLQYLLQFQEIDDDEPIIIIVAKYNGEHQIVSLDQLLPFGYKSRTGIRKLRKYNK